MYRALYRKWRPATFEDVVGQAGMYHGAEEPDIARTK